MASKWLPIESAPMDGFILVWRKYSSLPMLAKWNKIYEWYENEDREHLYNLTHWMPLPDPPKE